MKQILIFLTLTFSTFHLFGQTSYKGFIGENPIDLVTYIFSDGDARAFYVYTKLDNPIRTNGTLKNGLLTLIEKNSLGKARASLTFKGFNTKSSRLEGIWKETGSDKELKISLTKSFSIDYGDSIEWQDRELLQPVSLKDKYFKLMISKKKGDFFARVKGIKIFGKKTDQLLQQFSVDCELSDLDEVSIGDYNFDGFIDFSIFEHSYAGSNSSSLYFLYNPKTHKYFESSFVGTSLDFDPKTKRIYEHNECCAGQSLMTAEYKVVRNKMVLLKKTCIEYDDKINDYKKVNCDD